VSRPVASCPDWRSLVARREREPEAWERALAHLDDCHRCGEEALAAEPTLLFRRLPRPAVGNADVESMKRAVANLRRTEPLQHPPRRPPATALRAAAVAALLLAAGLLRGSAPIGTPIDGAAGGTAVASTAPSAPIPAPKAADARTELSLEQMPLVELADPAAGSMIQVVDDEISVVVLMPPLDV
jgi:hypothetical protein